MYGSDIARLHCDIDALKNFSREAGGPCYAKFRVAAGLSRMITSCPGNSNLSDHRDPGDKIPICHKNRQLKSVRHRHGLRTEAPPARCLGLICPLQCTHIEASSDAVDHSTMNAPGVLGLQDTP